MRAELRVTGCPVIAHELIAALIIQGADGVLLGLPLRFFVFGKSKNSQRDLPERLYVRDSSYMSYGAKRNLKGDFGMARQDGEYFLLRIPTLTVILYVMVFMNFPQVIIA